LALDWVKWSRSYPRYFITKESGPSTQGRGG